MLDGSCCYPFPVVGWPASDPLVTADRRHPAVPEPGRQPAQARHRVVGRLRRCRRRRLGESSRAPTTSPGSRRRAPARALPDISMSAAVNGGIVVYYSFVTTAGFHIFGGTSEASPLFSGIVALAAQRAGHGLGQINPALYALQGSASSGIVDVDPPQHHVDLPRLVGQPRAPSTAGAPRRATTWPAASARSTPPSSSPRWRTPPARVPDPGTLGGGPPAVAALHRVRVPRSPLEAARPPARCAAAPGAAPRCRRAPCPSAASRGRRTPGTCRGRARGRPAGAP